MKKKQYVPKGWTLKKLREVAEHYDNQTDEEGYQEIERAIKNKQLSWIAVPHDMLDEINALIAKRQSA